MRKDWKYTLRSAYSAGTFSNSRTQFKAFLLFCTYFHFTLTPATLDTLCLYVEFLSRTLSPPAIRNYLSGVKLLHLFSGLDIPFRKDFLLSLTFRGIARNALHTPRRAPPVTPDVLCHISKVLDFEKDPISCTLFCAFLFTLFLMARLANIVLRSRKCFDPSRNLTRSDVATNQHGLIGTFKCTKTIQFGERQLHIPLLRLPGSPICPVSAYHRMVRLVPASSRPALFVLPSHSGLSLLTQQRFIAAFRRAISAAGLRFASAYGGHSFRRSAASWAFNHSIPGELIQIYGDWASDAYKAYLEFSVESKLAFGQQLRSAVLSGTS